MALVVAVILIIFVLGKMAVEKGGEYEYEQKKQEREKISSAFEEKYVDKLLEDQLWDYVRDERNFDAVAKEMYAAFAEMEHFKDVNVLLLNKGCIDYSLSKKKIEEQTDLMIDNQQLAVDIMLANRGKISTYVSIFGHEAHIYPDGSSELFKYRAFELIEWIRDTLKKQGVVAVPVYIKQNDTMVDRGGKYCWKGSSEEVFARTFPDELTYTILPFDRSLIEKKQHKIPKPYYEKDSTENSNGEPIEKTHEQKVEVQETDKSFEVNGVKYNIDW